MLNEDIYIVGSGPYGEVMFELAEICGYNVAGYFDEFDEKQGCTVMGTKVIDKLSNIKDEEIRGKKFIVAMGSNEARLKHMERIKRADGILPTLIHPTAVISKSAIIGEGVYIQANVTVWTKSKISDFCILSPNVVVAHHSSVGKACLISNQSAIGAYIEIANRVFVGMGATVVTGVNKIGENSTIGAGAVVLKDVEPNSVYVGVPAKKLRDK